MVDYEDNQNGSYTEVGKSTQKPREKQTNKNWEGKTKLYLKKPYYLRFLVPKMGTPIWNETSGVWKKKIVVVNVSGNKLIFKEWGMCRWPSLTEPDGVENSEFK